MRIRFSLDAALLFLGAALLPVYAFSSGGVQPAHAILAAFAGLTLMKRGIPFPAWSATLLALALYSFAVEGVYVLIGGNPKYLIHCAFFFYNFLIVCAVYQYVRANGITVLTYGIIAAAMIAFASILYSGVELQGTTSSGRETATFNNPNQLGYFSVCLLSLSYLFYRCGKISYTIAACLFAVAMFLAISSLSKAAMVANFVVIVLALMPTSRLGILAWIVAAAIAIPVILSQFFSGSMDDFRFVQRLVNMLDEDDSSLASRGYFAFMVSGNAFQMFFGLGKQNVTDIVGHEVHSTFASVMNDYGAVGLFLLAASMVAWSHLLWKRFGLIGLFCLVSPSILYGITHNGTRFTIFWLLFAASMAMASTYRVTNRRAFPAAAAPHGKLRRERFA